MNVESGTKPLQHENQREHGPETIKTCFPYFVEQQNEVQGEGQEQSQEAEVVEVSGEVILHTESEHTEMGLDDHDRHACACGGTACVRHQRAHYAQITMNLFR